jgi:hypothetical protein
VAFQPDVNDPQKTTTTVATCGGPYVVLIDVTSGEMLQKHTHKDAK